MRAILAKLRTIQCMAPDRLETANGDLLGRSRREILSLFGPMDQLSRAELARLSGLAPTTVSSAVAELEESGFLEQVPDTEDEAKGRGRPPVLYRRTVEPGLIAVVVVGRRQLRTAIISTDETMLEMNSTPLRSGTAAEDITEIGIEKMQTLLDKWDAEREELKFMGLGLPGPVQRELEIVASNSILPEWMGFDFGKRMQDKFGVPTTVDNDASLGLVGERYRGAAQGARDAIYLKISTGIGAGLLIGGRPYSGYSGTAGELGHISIDPNGVICRCGSVGCLETVASLPAIVASLRPALGQNATTETVFDALAAKNRSVERAFSEAARHVGRALAIFCNLMNPQMVILGGETSEAGEVFRSNLTRALRNTAIVPNGEVVQVVPAALGSASEIWGAFYQARARILPAHSG